MNPNKFPRKFWWQFQTKRWYFKPAVYIFSCMQMCPKNLFSHSQQNIFVWDLPTHVWKFRIKLVLYKILSEMCGMMGGWKSDNIVSFNCLGTLIKWFWYEFDGIVGFLSSKLVDPKRFNLYGREVTENIFKSTCFPRFNTFQWKFYNLHCSHWKMHFQNA